MQGRGRNLFRVILSPGVLAREWQNRIRTQHCAGKTTKDLSGHKAECLAGMNLYRKKKTKHKYVFFKSLLVQVELANRTKVQMHVTDLYVPYKMTCISVHSRLFFWKA